MESEALIERLAVCSWSLQPASPQDLIEQVAATGLHRVQLALNPLLEPRGPWANAAQLLQQHRIGVASGMFACLNEDYSTPAAIRRTGGLVPDSTWEQNWRLAKSVAALARELGLALVTFHAGFLLAGKGDRRLLERLGRISDLFGEHGLTLGLETGQETAGTLAEVLTTLSRPNLGVNFDPANMLLYNKGDPIAALHTLAPWLRQVHLKDARRPSAPDTWGEEVVVGTGEVDWPEFFATLQRLNFRGDYCIEREAGDQRVEDVRAARQHVAALLSPVAQPAAR